MAASNVEFDAADVRDNKDMASLGYVLFFLPLITCKESKLGRYCANQGLLLLIAFAVVRFVLRIFSWILLFGFLKHLAVAVVNIGFLSLGIYLAYQLRKHDRVTRLPYIGQYTLIK